jgi:hypothetical protein
MPADKVTVTQELLPCPFCGGAGDARKMRLGEFPRVVRYDHRENCPIQSMNPFDYGGWATKAEAIAAWNTRLSPGEGVAEALDMTRDLIQEAKGAEGPNGGFVTDHLDAAEGWLDKIETALSLPHPEQVRMKETYAEWQQKRGRAADLIDWAVQEFDEWMGDDDYDTRGCLDRIIERLRQYRDEARAALKES